MIRTTLLAAALLLGACTLDDSVGEGTPPPGEFLVPVTLTEHEIDIPADAPAGELTFQLDNAGDSSHGFVIEGDGVDERFPDEVPPGATETFTAELEPGTYTVWCPIGDHRERGMEAQFEVTEGTQTDAGAPDNGVGPSEEQDEIDDG